MATITPAVFAVHATLVATVVDTVTLTSTSNGVGKTTRVEVVNETPVGGSGVGNIYVTGNGSTPTVAGPDTYCVLPGTTKTIPYSTSVKLISAAAPAYTVQAVAGS